MKNSFKQKQKLVNFLPLTFPEKKTLGDKNKLNKTVLTSWLKYGQTAWFAEVVSLLLSSPEDIVKQEIAADITVACDDTLWGCEGEYMHMSMWGNRLVIEMSHTYDWPLSWLALAVLVGQAGTHALTIILIEWTY